MTLPSLSTRERPFIFGRLFLFRRVSASRAMRAIAAAITIVFALFLSDYRRHAHGYHNAGACNY